MFFSYCPENGFETHETAALAKEAAEANLEPFADEAVDGWSEQVDQICWGEIKGTCQVISRRPIDPESGRESQFTEIIDYGIVDDVTHPITSRNRPHLRPDGIPTRCDINLQSAVEIRLGEMIRVIEAVGAHPLLTDASLLVQQAKGKIADYVESNLG